jgi:hypothetical protein
MPMFGGKHFANPSVGKAHERGMASEVKAKPSEKGHADTSEDPAGNEGHDHPPAKSHIVHQAAGKFHGIGLHDQGVHQTEHGSLEEAHASGKACMAGSGGGNAESGGMQDFMGGSESGY